jgi:hypothetical protein
MAKIHGTSGGTRYLLNGTRPIHGKKLENLEDITRFLDNYPEILAEAERVEAKRQDEIILALENRETQLNQELKDNIDRHTREVYSHILEINDRIEASDSFFVILVYLIRFWGANLVSSYRIHLPLTGAKWNLWRFKKQKEKTIAEKPGIIRSAGKNITESQQFLTRHKSFFANAKGEEQILGVLSQLPDDYQVLSGVSLHLFDPMYWLRRKEKLQYNQIDHIVIGPTGLFLVGIKSWKGPDTEIKTDDLKRQVRVANFTLWCHMKDEYRFYEKNPKIRCVIVSLQGSHPDLKIDKFIDVIALPRLCEYITTGERTLSEMSVDKLVHLIPFRERN